jgi:hypothetical protein
MPPVRDHVRVGVLGLVCAGLILLVGCGATEPDPQASVAALPPAQTWIWSSASFVGADEAAAVLVAAGPNGFGAATADGPTLWTSKDGTMWSALPSGKASGSSLVTVVGLHDGTFIAPGFVPDEHGVFVRFDSSGIEVTAAGEGPDAVTHVLSTSDGYLAVGGTLAAPPAVEQAAVWRSADGRTWQRHDGPAEALFGPAAHGPTGFLAASNRSRAELGDGRADIWLSPDGNAWKLGASIEDATIEGIIATPKGFEAVGGASRGSHDLHPAAWHSPNGQEWRSTDWNDEGTFTGIVSWRDRLLAFGYSFAQQGILRVSTDGTAWEDVPGAPLEGVRVSGAAVTDDRLLLVGAEFNGVKSVVVVADLPP